MTTQSEQTLENNQQPQTNRKKSVKHMIFTHKITT